jgi:hypothetical protein
MDLRLAVHEFVNHGRGLLERLRSSEGDTLTKAELHVLEVQLYLLDKEVTKRKLRTAPPTAQSPPTVSPFDSPGQTRNSDTSNKDSG